MLYFIFCNGTALKRMHNAYPNICIKVTFSGNEWFLFLKIEKCCMVAFDTRWTVLFFQVCEVYNLHRETFYLGQDYFDRFMATQDDVLKTTLQLVGISCLFIAAKMEVCFTYRCLSAWTFWERLEYPCSVILHCKNLFQSGSAAFCLNVVSLKCN